MTITASKSAKTLRIFNSVLSLLLKGIGLKLRVLQGKPSAGDTVEPILDSKYMLQKNLKHLEFINFLEMQHCMTTKSLEPLEFKKKIERIKQETQKNTLALIYGKVA